MSGLVHPDQNVRNATQNSLCGSRAGVGYGRGLRGDRPRGRTANPRNRNPHGAGRPEKRRAQNGGEKRNGAGSGGYWKRSCVGGSFGLAETGNG